MKSPAACPLMQDICAWKGLQKMVSNAKCDEVMLVSLTLVPAWLCQLSLFGVRRRNQESSSVVVANTSSPTIFLWGFQSVISVLQCGLLMSFKFLLMVLQMLNEIIWFQVHSTNNPSASTHPEHSELTHLHWEASLTTKCPILITDRGKETNPH